MVDRKTKSSNSNTCQCDQDCAGLLCEPLPDFDLLMPTSTQVATEVKKQLLRREAQRVAKSIEAKELLELSEDRTFDGLAFLERRNIGEPLWGAGQRAFWARNQGFMVFGDDGAGKSTLIQQVLLSAKGLRSPNVLDYPVSHVDGVIVYIAADRPANIQESFARMVDVSDPQTAQKFKTGFRFWSGAVPFLADDDPKQFAQWCMDRANGEQVGMVVIDSVKDVVSDCSSNLAGAQFNRMVQELIEQGIEFGCCHHNRKANSDNKKPNQLKDVYGSRFLTAGLGSVLNIWIPVPSKPDRELSQLKTPYGVTISQIDYSNDAVTGAQNVSIDLGQHISSLLIKAGARGLTDSELVFRVYGLGPDEDGYPAARGKMTRWLNKQIDSGTGVYERAVRGDNRAKVWRLTSADDEPAKVVELDAVQKKRRKARALLADVDRRIAEIDSETK